jgi:hypothetical protein
MSDDRISDARKQLEMVVAHSRDGCRGLALEALDRGVRVTGPYTGYAHLYHNLGRIDTAIDVLSQLVVYSDGDLPVESNDYISDLERSWNIGSTKAGFRLGHELRRIGRPKSEVYDVFMKVGLQVEELLVGSAYSKTIS